MTERKSQREALIRHNTEKRQSGNYAARNNSETHPGGPVIKSEWSNEVSVEECFNDTNINQTGEHQTDTYICFSKNYHRHISAEHRWLDLKLKEIWQYRELILLFTRRSMVVSYKQTILGPAWILINPLMTAIVHNIVFGTIAQLSTDGLPQILFYLTGTALWSYFSSSLSGNASTFLGNAGLFGKVYFPRLTVPISQIMVYILRFGIQMILVVALMIYFGVQGLVHPRIWILLVFPAVLIELGLMGMGFGIIISSMTTKYRDLTVLVGFGLSLWMYGTPVVYPLTQLGDGFLRTLIILNPVSMPFELFRWALLGKGTVIWWSYGLSWAVTLVAVFFGIIIFNRIERNFMDTI